MSKDGYKITKQTKHINANGEYWTTEEQVIARYNDKGYLYKSQANTIKSFLDKPYPNELTWAERGKLGRLEYELKSDQILAYKSNATMKPHPIATISNMLGCNENNTRKLIRKCKKLGVIGQANINNNKFFLLNPMYKLHGNRVSLTAFIVFEKQLKEEIPEWVIEKYLEDMKISDKKIKIIE